MWWVCLLVEEGHCVHSPIPASIFRSWCFLTELKQGAECYGCCRITGISYLFPTFLWLPNYDSKAYLYNRPVKTNYVPSLKGNLVPSVGGCDVKSNSSIKLQGKQHLASIIFWEFPRLVSLSSHLVLWQWNLLNEPKFWQRSIVLNGMVWVEKDFKTSLFKKIYIRISAREIIVGLKMSRSWMK